ncbi:hypothetical protein DKG34_09375 [Streptomyces sp. NWU49]|uniref:hypothetical protein n=1 Tax=Streptomyces sp. NWU49 TaxID=2201153 RepID=UPI000D67A64C|nr:hypothetical protein [Streptomyces sp. NWU49]PWJ07651.1 hypothetical protein DKG34_09375 [Streptomyces sp. NWU49]
MDPRSLDAPPHPADRDPRARVVPAVATALLSVLGPAALLFAGLSPMATDSCGPDDCSPALTTSLALVHGILVLGGPLTAGAWLAAWLLPRTHRWSVPRIWLAGLSLLPPVLVLVLVFTLPPG